LGSIQPSADFYAYYYNYALPGDPYIDSIFGGGEINFTAVYKNAKKYTWYIGTDTLYTRTIDRFFEKQFIGQTIPITLIVEYEPNTLCDKSNGRDTITKSIKLIDPCDLATHSKYRTAIEGTTDSINWEWIPASIRSNDIFVGPCQVEGGLSALIGLMHYLEPNNTEFKDTVNIRGGSNNSAIIIGSYINGEIFPTNKNMYMDLRILQNKRVTVEIITLNPWTLETKSYQLKGRKL